MQKECNFTLLHLQYQKEEVGMLSIQYNQNLRNVVIGIIMLVIAILFILYMGDAMVDSTREFRSGYIQHLLK